MKHNSEQVNPSNANERRAWLAAARGELDQNHAYSETQMILSKLQQALTEHSATLAKLRARANRLEEMARGYVERDWTLCFEGDLTAIANQLISGSDLTQVIAAARLPLDKSLYPKLKFPESGDLETIKEIDFERAAVMALQHAVQLQKKNIVASRRQAIFELNRSLAEPRAAIARQVLKGLKNLNELAGQDRGLAGQLDPAEVEFLKPRPFPMQMLSGETISWFLECVSEGLIEGEEMTALGLG